MTSLAGTHDGAQHDVVDSAQDIDLALLLDGYGLIFEAILSWGRRCWTFLHV